MKIYLLRKIRFLSLITLLGFFAYILGYGSARLIKIYAFEKTNNLKHEQTETEKSELNHLYKKGISEPSNQPKSNSKKTSKNLDNRSPAQTQKK